MPADGGFLCDKPAVLDAMIEEVSRITDFNTKTDRRTLSTALCTQRENENCTHCVVAVLGTVAWKKTAANRKISVCVGLELDLVRFFFVNKTVPGLQYVIPN
jgi:hypothetical protein